MELTVWRHPLPKGVSGRCIGLCDVPVDRRKAKRLAHRVRGHARGAGLLATQPKPVVWTSPLLRAFAVGRVLRRWGWAHCVDARLSELDFGAWDGLTWSSIDVGEIDAWCEDFAHARPGGGESVSQLLARCRSFIDEQPHRQGGPGCIVVGHAGWINALRWITSAPEPRALPTASQWPAPLAYLKRAEFDIGG